MAKDLIRYDLLAQQALRGLVRKVLADAAQQGLPGEHHFYVKFATEAPGVLMSPRLRGQYPEEMTIVLQHQFWDLDVTEEAVSITLSFNAIPERLTVPFSAIRGFFDPSVQFGLEFDAEDAAEDGAETPQAPPPVFAAETDGDAIVAEAAQDDAPPDDAPRDGPEPDADTEDDADTETEDGATVVSLDAFRKKS